MCSSLRQSFERVRRNDLELAGLLPPQKIQEAMQAAGYVEHATLYTAVVTMLTFLAQVLRADRSCQQAVNGLIAQRVAADQSVCSADTGGFCKARQRLPEPAFWDLLRQAGRIVEQQADALWLGRRVRVVDGSTLKLQDTAANRREYPLQAGQVPGTSYPLARILVVFSLAVGTVLEAAIRPYQGKGTGETGMLRSLAGSSALAAGDVLLGDRYFAGYWDIAFWQARGLDIVTRLPKSRTVDFRKGVRLGSGDVLVIWHKTARPDWLTPEEAQQFPDSLTLRAVRVRVRVVQPGFRTQVLIVLTTLLDPVAYPSSELADLYRRRWQAELNLRSLKTHLGMEHLRTKQPKMVRKEFAMHLLAYNCVRRVGAEAAREGQVPAWSISFKGSQQALNEFLPRLHHTRLQEWLDHLVHTAQQIRVDRRDRIEPRATKQRPKEYPVLSEPRSRYKKRIQGRR
jgi:putative transposase